MVGLKLSKEASDKFNNAVQNPDMEGFMEKQGAIRKNWKERWFVIKDHFLFYCKKKGVLPQGIINLVGCKISQDVSLGKPNVIALQSASSVSIDASWNNRVYHIAAPDEGTMKQWMQVFAKFEEQETSSTPEKQQEHTQEPATPSKEKVEPAKSEVVK